MTAFNVVRFKVKAGKEQQFIDVHRAMKPGLKGFLSGSLISTGDRNYCLVAEWRNFNAIVAARPKMIGMLDSVRDLLEDRGGDLGVTDPVSGATVLKLRLAPKAKAKARSKAKRPASRPANRAVRRPAKKR